MSRVHHVYEYDPNIAVSGYKLERIKSCKLQLLGVHINEHVKWDDHITRYLDAIWTPRDSINTQVCKKTEITSQI